MRLVLLILIIPFFLFASDVDTLMEKAGLNKQISALKDSSLAYLNLLDTENEMQMLFKNHLYKNFDDKILISKVKESIEKKLTGEEIKELNIWFSSEVGSRIVKAEIDSSKADELTGMVLMLPELIKDKKRLMRIIKIESYLNYTSYSMRLTQTLFDTIIPNNKQTAIFREAFYRSYAQKMYHEVLAFFLFTYRDVSYEDLDLYIEFLSKDSAKKFSKTVMETQLDILIEWIFKSIRESRNIV